MTRSLVRLATTTGIAMALCACGGGGGGGSGVTSTPAPAPSPTPPPAPPTPAATPLTGVTQNTEFSTVGDPVQIRWDQQAGTYEVKLPSSDWAALTPGTYGVYQVSLSGSTPAIDRAVLLHDDYDYTGVVKMIGESGYEMAGTAFGIPTTTAQMPVTGSATYLGTLDGYDGADAWISGDANFLFDFGAGTLAGYFHPIANGGWTGGDLGQYDFVNTVYSSGSTAFSGGLINAANSLTGAFDGNFNGPGAAELMGQWTIDVNMCTISWCDEASPIRAISGIVVGKKQ